MPQAHFCLWGTADANKIVGRLSLDECRAALESLANLFGSSEMNIEEGRPDENYGWVIFNNGERIEILRQD